MSGINLSVAHLKYINQIGKSDEMKTDNVKPAGDTPITPNHYLSKSGRDIFDTVEEFFPPEGVRTKYVSMVWEYTYRAEFKNGVEDLRKAQEVLNRYIKYLESKENKK